MDNLILAKEACLDDTVSMKDVKVYFVHVGSGSMIKAAVDPSLFKGRSLCHYLYDEYVGGSKTWDTVKKKANQRFARFTKGNKTYLVMFVKDPIKTTETEYAIPQTSTQREILKQLKKKTRLRRYASTVVYAVGKHLGNFIVYPAMTGFAIEGVSRIAQREKAAENTNNLINPLTQAMEKMDDVMLPK
jgi:hypothetical protein